MSGYLRVAKQLRDLGFELTGVPEKDEAIAGEILKLCNQRMQELMAVMYKNSVDARLYRVTGT